MTVATPRRRYASCRALPFKERWGNWARVVVFGTYLALKTREVRKNFIDIALLFFQMFSYFQSDKPRYVHVEEVRRRDLSMVYSVGSLRLSWAACMYMKGELNELPYDPALTLHRDAPIVGRFHVIWLILRSLVP
jgi:hypothetical protein